MLRGNKTEVELRFELLTWGLILLTVVFCWVLFRESLPSLMLFVPGLILFGSALFQDMQPDWTAGWLTYILSTIVVATGFVGIVNTLFETVEVAPYLWLIIAIVQLGVVLVVKALYDPKL